MKYTDKATSDPFITSICKMGELSGYFLMNNIRLPESVIIHIASYLDGYSLARLTMVSKAFYNLNYKEKLWQRLCKERWPDQLLNIDYPPTRSWRVYFASRSVNNIILLLLFLLLTYSFNIVYI